MSVLSLTLAGQLAGDQDVREVKRLDASKRGITEVEDLRWGEIELLRIERGLFHSCFMDGGVYVSHHAAHVLSSTGWTSLTTVYHSLEG